MDMYVLGIVGLIAMLAAGAWYDAKANRIPNRLVASGMLFGLGVRLYAEGLPGMLDSAEGVILGLLLLLPFYHFRTLGAGDVKLMAAVGAYLGPQEVMGAVLATFLAGGVIAIIIIVQHKLLRPLLDNFRFMAMGHLIEIGTGHAPRSAPEPEPVARLPYALAIGSGVVGWLVWRGVN
jgi:prepilin peptidase CpaA